MTTPESFDEARELLLSGPNYPGLFSLPRGTSRLTMWRFPSLAPWQTWVLVQNGPCWMVRRMTWAQARRPLEPAQTYVAEAFLPGTVAEALIEGFDVRYCPVEELPATLGIDGTTFGVAVPDVIAPVWSAEWWWRPPGEWRALADWHDQAHPQLDAWLPQATKPDRR